MSWIEFHRLSEGLAAEAEVALRRGDHASAKELYGKAAVAESQALAAVDPSKARTYGVSAVSAVSLHFKAAQLSLAEVVAHRALATQGLPAFAMEQLRGLLQAIWNEQAKERADLRFAPGQVVVSVRGGEVIEGGAPLDLIVEKVQTVQALFYRTAEFLRGLPHRRRGAPAREIQEICRPWLFQTAPGSYQFAVAVQEPRQSDLFRADDPRPTEVADQFLRILRSTVEDPEGLTEVVPDSDYRGTFLKLTRNLAPTGKTFSELDIRPVGETRSVVLRPESRRAVSQSIRQLRGGLGLDRREESLRGVLRAVHLDRDWLEVAVGDAPVRVNQVVEAVDDVIGPLVNKPVVVLVVRDSRNKYQFRDIEADD